MRAVITGGLGSMGTYLVRRLVHEGHQVTVYDNLAKDGTRRNRNLLTDLSRDIKIYETDCLKVRSYGSETDVIFHLAGDCSAPRSLVDPVRSFRLNATMTCVVLEAARKYCTPVVYTSSVRAYPNTLGQYTIYGLGKWVGDLLCTEYARTFGVPTISNRLGAIYGVYQYGTSESGWLNWFVRAMVQRLPLELHGGGLQKRDCLHSEDAARLLIAQARHLIDTQSCKGLVYDVGGGLENYVSLVEVLEHLHHVHGYSLDLVTQAPRRHADVEGRPAANIEVATDFNWKPEINIWKGIGEMVEFYEVHRASS